MLEKWLQFVKGHHTLLCIVLGGLLLFHFGEKWFSHVSKVDDQKAELAQQQLDTQKQANVVLATQVATLQAQVTQQNAALEVAMKQRNQAVVVQQKQDEALPLPQLGDRWATLLTLPTTDFIASPTGITANDEAAHKTVDQLESIAALQADLKDSQAQTVNDDKLIVALQSQVAGLQKQIVDEENARKLEVVALKADARKGKMKWFKVGFITGFVAGLATRLVH